MKSPWKTKGTRGCWYDKREMVGNAARLPHRVDSAIVYGVAQRDIYAVVHTLRSRTRTYTVGGGPCRCESASREGEATASATNWVNTDVPVLRRLPFLSLPVSALVRRPYNDPCLDSSLDRVLKSLCLGDRSPIAGRIHVFRDTFTWYFSRKARDGAHEGRCNWLVDW